MKNQSNQNNLVGVRLKKLRADRNLNQSELSKLSGVTAAQISRYENNSAVPNAIVIKKLSNALNVDYDDLALEIPTGELSMKDYDVSIEKSKKLPRSYLITIKEIVDKFVELNTIHSVISSSK